MTNPNRTGEKVASLAGTTLGSKDASPEEKRLAASALAQSHTDKSTGKAVETAASQVLRDKTATANAKSLAGSLVSQSNRKP